MRYFMKNENLITQQITLMRLMSESAVRHTISAENASMHHVLGKFMTIT